MPKKYRIIIETKDVDILAEILKMWKGPIDNADMADIQIINEEALLKQEPVTLQADPQERIPGEGRPRRKPRNVIPRNLLRVEAVIYLGLMETDEFVRLPVLSSLLEKKVIGKVHGVDHLPKLTTLAACMSRLRKAGLVEIRNITNTDGTKIRIYKIPTGKRGLPVEDVVKAVRKHDAEYQTKKTAKPEAQT